MSTNKNENTIEETGSLLTNRRISKNSIINIFGYAAPMIVALFTIPGIIKGMGTERFGILTLAWAVIGYFSLFDFGLNRALTKLVSERLGRGANDEIPDLIWTSLIIMALLGICVAGLLISFLPWLVEEILHIPQALKRETLISFSFLALAVPVIILSVGLRGVLSAYQKFNLINWVRVPMGIYVFVAPLPIIWWYSNALHPILAALILGRVVGLLAQLRMCLKIVPFINAKVRFRRHFIRPLLSYGGWVTICNVVSPLMIYIDRFFISALISTSAVAYYATPNEIATKLWMLPWAVLGVLFPAFSTSLVQDEKRATGLFENSFKYLILIFFAVILVVISFSFEGLTLWLGSEFAKQSAKILQVMLIGVFLHGIAQIPYALLQGAGRPDIIAKLHMVELPIYCLLLWQMTLAAGTIGAALAWTIRLGIDAVVIFFFSAKLMPAVVGSGCKRIGLLLFSIFLYIPAFWIEDIMLKCMFCTMFMLLFIGFSWFVLFSEKDRKWVLQRISHAS